MAAVLLVLESRGVGCAASYQLTSPIPPQQGPAHPVPGPALPVPCPTHLVDYVEVKRLVPACTSSSAT